MRKTFRLRSKGNVNAPALVRWGIECYSQTERPTLLGVFETGYNAPPEVFDRLLQGKIPYKVDKRDSVVFRTVVPEPEASDAT